MEKEMRELYIEGLAPHGGPESCVDDPRGRGEALTGVGAGRAMEPRNPSVRGADAVQEAEGNIAGGVMRESPGDPARSGNHGMYGTFMRENREIPRSPTGLITGRVAQGTRVGTPEMHGGGGGKGADQGEHGQLAGSGRRAGAGLSQGLDRVRQVAKRDKKARFTALMHHVDIDGLREAYRSINARAAAGRTG